MSDASAEDQSHWLFSTIPSVTIKLKRKKEKQKKNDLRRKHFDHFGPLLTVGSFYCHDVHRISNQNKK